MKLAELAKWVEKMPVWQLFFWFVWAVVGLLLLIVTLKTRQATVDTSQAERLARIEKRLEELATILRQPIVVPIALPEPIPSRHYGWHIAAAETVGTAQSGQPDPSKVQQVFEVVTEPTALVNVILGGRATVTTLSLNKADASAQTTPYEVRLHMKNDSSSSAEVRIPKGQVFENAEPHSGLQNLVAANDTTVVLGPSEERTLNIAAYCLNHHLGPPAGQAGNITPLKLRFDFVDQSSVWKGVERVVGPVVGATKR